MSSRRLELGGVAALTVAALALFAIGPTYPNYDAYYHLVWGREILDGQRPTFDAYAAPTQHPLYVALGVVLSLLGGGGERALVLLTVLALVALVWATYRIGAASFGPWPGLAAAAFVAGSFSLLLYAVRGYVDVPFLAMVAWAGVLEAERGRDDGPGRARAVMALLMLAGLLRPEAWLLGGLYSVWRWRRCDGRERVLLGALAVAAPLLWCASDFVVTGDPLYSLHATSDLAEALDRRRGAGALPGAFVHFLADTLRPPVALLGAVGVAVAVWRPGARRAAVPLALLLAGSLTFFATGLAGLSVIPRYLTVAAVGLSLLAGQALLGFARVAPGRRLRLRWAWASAAAIAGGLAIAGAQAPAAAGRLVDELRFQRHAHDDLVALVKRPEVAAGMRCGPLTFPTYRLVPDARWALRAGRDRVSARSALRRRHGVAVFVVGRQALKRFGFADGASPRTNVPDEGFVRAVRVGMLVAYVSCPTAP